MSISDTLTAARDGLSRRIRRRSMVTRDPELVIWFRRAVLKRRPVLHHIEVHITDHCNLNCKGCAHFSNLCRPAFADLAEFEDDMGHMAAIFSAVREIYLIGGEPLLHPKVTEFCVAARKVFRKSRIYLKTNGTLVMGMDAEFWDVLAKNKIRLLVDPYPVNQPLLEIELLGKARHVKVEWTDVEQELYKTPIDPRGGYDAHSSFRRCQGFANRPLLRHGRIYPCANIAFADVFRERFGVKKGLEAYPTDWIDIRDEPDPELVFSFLRSPVHWCSNCDMDNREFFEWEPSTRHISEWTTAPPPLQRPVSTPPLPAQPSSPAPPATPAPPSPPVSPPVH